MARPRTIELDQLLDVAERLATAGDPDGLTLRRLAAEAGASNGSIYHAFSSKEELLARVWIRAAWRLLSEQTARVEAAVADASSAADADHAVLLAALWPVEFAIEHPVTARLFFGQRRDQLFSPHALPAEITDELAAVQRAFTRVLVMLARARWDRTDRIAVDAIAVCVVDLPGGLLQRKLVTSVPLDDRTTAQLEAACRAVLALPLQPAPTRTPRTIREREARR